MDIAGAIAAGEALWSAGTAARAEWLAEGFRALSDPASALGARARAELPASSGLSPEMVEWALHHALHELTDPRHLTALADMSKHGHLARPGRLCSIVLAGNVFTAAARAVLWPLLLGWPVVAKASRDDALFPLLLAEALSPRFPGVFQAEALGPGEQLDRLFAASDAVSVYGSDETVRDVRSKIPADARFQAHGHGLGAAYIARAADPQHLHEYAQSFARDVAAYDQRGCMSPHGIWVEGDAEAFAALLHRELGALAQSLPRGPLSFAQAEAQRGYRDQAALRGTLHEGSSHAVTCEPTFRASPGYRNVQVLSVESRSAFLAQIAAFGAHLKCLALAGTTTHELAPHLPSRVAPRLCALGHMQTPPAGALTDGYPPWEGLARFIDAV